MPILIFRDRFFFRGQMQFERWQFQLQESQREVGQSFPVPPVAGYRSATVSLFVDDWIDR